MSKEYQESIEILKAYKDKLEVSCSNQLDRDINAFDLAIKALEDRPQGDWGKWIIYVIQCPDCLECFNFPTKYYPMELLKECPNCGADMRKETENEDS